MPSDSYITAAEYNTITGRDVSEATDARLKRASLMLDRRLGLDIHATKAQHDDLLLLDLANLPARDQEAVKQWVAWFVVGLVDNNDSVAISSSLKLGRFSVGPDGADGDNLIPDELKYADILIKALVRRDVPTLRNTPYYDFLADGVIN